jgi:hypothetical protein
VTTEQESNNDATAVTVAAGAGAGVDTELAAVVGADPFVAGAPGVDVVDELQAAIKTVAPARTKRIRRT